MAIPKLTARVYDRKGRLLSTGSNLPKKSHPQQAAIAARMGEHYKIWAHAEVAALVRVRDGTPYKITIERFGKRGQPLNAKPCQICEWAIKQAGIQVIEYTIG
jgi:deoxycytidylate deaminase